MVRSGPQVTTLLRVLARAVVRMRRGQGKRKSEGTELPPVSRRRRKEEEEAVQEARRRAAPSVREFKYNKKRVRLVSQGSDLKDGARCILYWMSRDQRVQGVNQLVEREGKRSSQGWQKPWSLPTAALGAGPPPLQGRPGGFLLQNAAISIPSAEHPSNTAPCAFSPDNWAFLYAQRLALKQELPLHVCFCLVPKFLDATIRHYGFMLRGLQEVAEVWPLRGCPRWVGQGSWGRGRQSHPFSASWWDGVCRGRNHPIALSPSVQECAELDIPFHLLLGYAKDVLPAFVVEHGVGGLVTDFCPLRLPRQWVEDVRERLPEDVPFAQVGAHALGGENSGW